MIFKIIINIDKKNKKNLKFGFFKNFGGLLTPLHHFEYYFKYDIQVQRNISL